MEIIFSKLERMEYLNFKNKTSLIYRFKNVYIFSILIFFKHLLDLQAQPSEY